MKLTQWLSISVFVTICGAIVTLSLVGNWDGGEFRNLKSSEPIVKQSEVSFFKKAKYYLLRDNKRSLNLNATELTIDAGTGRTIFLEPVGIAFSKAGDPVNYKGKSGLLSEGKSDLVLEGEVSMDLENSRFNSDRLNYNFETDKLESKGNVHTFSKSQKTGDEVEVFSDSSISYPKSEKSQYLGNVRGKIIRKRDYEESVFFKSKRLDLDMKTHQIDLIDDVSLKKQEFTASSYRGEIFLENYNKRLKYFVLYDDVKVVETVKPRDGSSPFTRRAFAEKLEGIVSEGKVVLTGSPKVYQYKDVIKGNKIVLRENNEVVEVDDANTKFDLK